MRGRQRKLLPLPAIMLAALACTTVSNDLLQEVGTTILFVTDSDLRPQSFYDPEGTIQVAEWTLSRAELFLGDEDEVGADLLFKTSDTDTCLFTDTAFIIPSAEGRCSSGMVIGASGEDPVPARLALTFTMTVRRAEPVDDDDFIEFPADNCPFLYNPDQQDENSDGIGDACQVVGSTTGSRLLDTDGDGVPDSADNCIWTPNPDQADTMGAGAREGVLDAIGDACVEQLADVEAGTDIVLVGSFDLTQLQNQVTYLVVDFHSSESLTGCWTGGACTLNESAVGFCVNTSLSSATGGCP